MSAISRPAVICRYVFKRGWPFGGWLTGVAYAHRDHV